ncbi:hypothetical protein D3C78_1716990 [compost metagenome]
MVATSDRQIATGYTSMAARVPVRIRGEKVSKKPTTYSGMRYLVRSISIAFITTRLIAVIR